MKLAIIATVFVIFIIHWHRCGVIDVKWDSGTVFRRRRLISTRAISLLGTDSGSTASTDGANSGIILKLRELHPRLRCRLVVTLLLLLSLLLLLILTHLWVLLVVLLRVCLVVFLPLLCVVFLLLLWLLLLRLLLRILVAITWVRRGLSWMLGSSCLWTHLWVFLVILFRVLIVVRLPLFGVVTMLLGLLVRLPLLIMLLSRWERSVRHARLSRILLLPLSLLNLLSQLRMLLLILLPLLPLLPLLLSVVRDGVLFNIACWGLL